MIYERRNKLLKENINLLRKIAWSYHKSTNINWDDLFEEACLGFLLNIEKYDQNKAQLSTWITTSVRNHINDFIRENDTRGEDSLEFMEEKGFEAGYDYFAPHFSRKEFMESIKNNLSTEAIEAVHVLFDCPGEIFMLAPKLARGKFRDTLREKGYQWKTIWAVLNELQAVMNIV